MRDTTKFWTIDGCCVNLARLKMRCCADVERFVKFS
jgi:hypothetical protein